MPVALCVYKHTSCDRRHGALALSPALDVLLIAYRDEIEHGIIQQLTSAYNDTTAALHASLYKRDNFVLVNADPLSNYTCFDAYILLYVYIRVQQEALEFSPLHRVLSRALHERPGVYASAAAATATATSESSQ
eukprot:10063-Heterococcus_DN1.PRE.3